MRELTFTDIDALESSRADSVPFAMDEDAFRLFYDRTAGPLWAYLSRLTGDRALADDFLQETYYRFLRTVPSVESEAHARNYLFRIATNLVRDNGRRQLTRPKQIQTVLSDAEENRLRIAASFRSKAAGSFRLKAEATTSLNKTEELTDLRRAWEKLKPRERALLWLAYAHGSSHRDIGDTLGVRKGSIKMMLFRARRKLAALLRGPQPEGARRAKA
jgi:RNA polymerase sigma-70 factor (ECF subfamily)